MIKLLVVADDMTGALDTGVQFARDGYRIYVAPLENISILPVDDIEILVIDTESRHLPAEEASDRVLKAVAAAGVGVRTYYKKTDSTLRGNIGAELEAILTGSRREAVAYLPSYPDGGRTTLRGELLLDGVPVAQTAFASDPLNPVRTSFIPELLAAQTKLPTEVAAGTSVSPLSPGSIVIFDAERNVELERLAERLRSERHRLVFAGCAGFAAYLNRMIDPPSSPRESDPPPSSARRLIVCGSLNPRSLAQLERAQSLGIAAYPLETLLPLAAAPAEGSQPPKEAGAVERIREQVETNGTVAIRTTQPGRSREADGLRVAEQVGKIVKALTSAIGFDTLIVFGGDTLMAIMREIGVVGVLPIGEVESGVPVSIAVQSTQPRDDEDRIGAGRPQSVSYHRSIVVSKAGGFGNDDVLERIGEYLDHLPERPPDSR